MSNSYADIDEKPIRIELKSKAAVSGAHIFLKDIADIRVRGDSGLRIELGNIRISKAPRVGRKTRIGQERIRYLLKKRFHNIETEISWKGPEYSEVAVLGQLFDYTRVQDIAKHKLTVYLSERYQNFSVTESSERQNILLPMGRVRMKSRMHSEALNKKMMVWVDLAVDGNHYQSIPVWFTVQVISIVNVLKKDKERLSILRKSDFTTEQRDISNINALPPDMKKLINTRLLSAMKKGQIVLPRHVQSLPAVSKGQAVKVYASHGEVRLQTQGIALEDGEIGNSVDVENPKTKQIFRAYVIKANVVTTEKGKTND